MSPSQGTDQYIFFLYCWRDHYISAKLRKITKIFLFYENFLKVTITCKGGGGPWKTWNLWCHNIKITRIGFISFITSMKFPPKFAIFRTPPVMQRHKIVPISHFVLSHQSHKMHTVKFFRTPPPPPSLYDVIKKWKP